MRYIVVLIGLGIVVAIGLSSDVGDAQPSGVGLAGRCSSDASCAADGANPRKCSMLGNGVGVCVDTCAAVTCAPGQQADRRGGGCICLEQKGAGQACSADAECGGGGRCVQFTATAFSDGKPGGKVCVPATAQTCNPAKSPSCQAPTSCAATDASGNGWCAPAYTTGPTSHVCRFDDVATASNCVRADPFGGSCGSCAWSGPSRTCDPNLHKCIGPGICTAEIPDNNIDEDCDGADAKTPTVCVRVDADHDGYCEPGACVNVVTPAANQIPASSCKGDESASCDTDASHHPGAPPVCMTDTNCDGNPFEGCPSCMTHTGSYWWSCNGPLPGKNCISVNEPADPDTWSDNYLCSDHPNPFKWSTAGPINGMRCTRIYEDAEPPAHTWNDNYLCVSHKANIVVAWSQNSPIAGMECLQWNEPADPHAWADNYLCWRIRHCPDDVDCPDDPGHVDAGCSREAPFDCCSLPSGGHICGPTRAWCGSAKAHQLCDVRPRPVPIN